MRLAFPRLNDCKMMKKDRIFPDGRSNLKRKSIMYCRKGQLQKGLMMKKNLRKLELGSRMLDLKMIYWIVVFSYNQMTRGAILAGSLNWTEIKAFGQ